MNDGRKTSGSKLAIAPGKRRSDAGTVRVSERDLELLRFIGEQYAVTLPQLAQLMGRSHHAARWLRSRWQAAGWAEGRALLVGEPVFVWLTRAGQRACDLDYKLWRPSPGRLAHVTAVSEVRIYVEARRPECEWISERELARQEKEQARSWQGHRPDAVVLLDDREVAVEVELTQKKGRRTEQIVRELAARYGASGTSPKPDQGGDSSGASIGSGAGGCDPELGTANRTFQTHEHPDG